MGVRDALVAVTSCAGSDSKIQLWCAWHVRAARDLGNVQAARRRGPTSYGKRIVRRKVYRTS